MNCDDFLSMLDDYVSGTLPDAEKKDMENHLKTCRRCQTVYTMKKDLPHLYENEKMPEEFTEKWKTALREEQKKNDHKVLSFPSKVQKFLSVAAVILFVAGGTFLTRDSLHQLPDTNAAKSDMYQMQGVPTVTMAEESNFSRQRSLSDSAPDQQNGQTEKIIRTASFTLESQYIDRVQSSIKEKVQASGGRIENINVYGEKLRTVHMTLRIPENELDTFLASSKELGNVQEYSESRKDVSDQYYDTESRLNTQKEKMNRLNELFEKADEVSELIEIETAMADTQYLIDRYTSSLNQLDSKVSFSQVDITLLEVIPEEDHEASFLSRAGSVLHRSLTGGMAFIKDMFLFVLSLLPWILGLGAVIFIVRVIYKKKHHKKG